MSTQGSLDRSLSPPPSIPLSLVEKDEVTSENGPCAAIVEAADQRVWSKCSRQENGAQKAFYAVTCLSQDHEMFDVWKTLELYW
jgi:hypothetical protein